MKKGVSIIICTYNGSSFIEKTLQHLSAQVFNDIPCEIILVDNASTDDTAVLAAAIWTGFKNTAITFRVVYEPAAGLAYARTKGINEAKFEFAVFCDDDNWLAEDYVQTTYNLFTTNPDAGILGGCGIPKFEDPALKPAWFDDFQLGYAVGEQAEKETYLTGVYGAGMSVRTAIVQNVINKQPFFLQGRKQKNLSAGEDGEIYYRVLMTGYKVLYSPTLTFKHFIPSGRLTWTYLKTMHLGFSKSHAILNLYGNALFTTSARLPYFHWLKKALYYWGIYLKYWPQQYLVYRDKEGTAEEIRHITWKCIALNYMRYNFELVKIYGTLASLKKSLANQK